MHKPTVRAPLRKDDSYNTYVKDFYRKIEDYDWNAVIDNHVGLESYLHRAREKHTRKLIEKYAGDGPALDVGCGTGLILRHLPEGSTGIDLNPRHLERAGQYAPHATVHVGDAENLEFPDESFATVVCTETLEHLVFPEKAMEHIHRVLKPGGMFIGSSPRKAFLWRLRFLSSTHYHNEPFHYEWNKGELQDLFSAFEVLELRTIFLNSIFLFALRKKA